MSANSDQDWKLEKWASKSMTRGGPLWRAALGIAQGAFLPDGKIDLDARKKLVEQALAIDSRVGPELHAMAWVMEGCELRRILMALGMDPLAIQGKEKAEHLITEPAYCGAPPLLLALAHGNTEAIRQAVGEFGLKPCAALFSRAGGSGGDEQTSWRPEDGSDWLGWSLFFQQWHMAGLLWQMPAARTNLDRALFECVRGAVAHHRSQHNAGPVKHSDIEGAGAWVARLMDAGANAGQTFKMNSHLRGKNQWFPGPIAGMDQMALEAAGWEFKDKVQYCGYATFGRRGKQDGARAWTAAEILWREDTPALNQFPSADGRREDTGDLERMQDRLDQSIGLLGRMTEGLTEQAWGGVVRQVLDATAAHVFSTMVSAAARWPDWLHAGFERCPAEMLIATREGDPRCIWLDLISVHNAACASGFNHLGEPYPEKQAIIEATGRALDTVGRRIPAETGLWTRGVQRAIAAHPDTLKDGSGRGLDQVLARLPAAFQTQAQAWMDDYRSMRQAADGLNAWSDEAKSLQEALVLQLRALEGIQATAPRRKPAVRL